MASYLWQRIKKEIITLVRNLRFRGEILFVAEAADWVIKEIGKEIVGELNRHQAGTALLSYGARGMRSRIVHYGSVGTLVQKEKIFWPHPSNKTVLTWYHVLDGDPRLGAIAELNRRLDVLHTTCSLTARVLQEHGMDPQKIIVIPESIDLATWRPYDTEERQAIRRRLGLPEGKSIIGSFQKDGVGWGEGTEPKLEKGPDVFCDVVERLANTHDLHVLLTGPARGYVTQRLDAAGISYTHQYLDDYTKIIDYYNALDLYIIASRIEGGPKAVLESFATKTPLVSTRVGMAIDLIDHETNGMLVDVEDIDALVDASLTVLDDPKLAARLVDAAYADVQAYTHEKIVARYSDEIYRPLGLSLV